MRAWVALAATLAVVVGGALFVLGEREVRRAGNSSVPPSAEVRWLGPGERVCQPVEVPPDASVVRLWTSPEHGVSALRVVVRERGAGAVAGRTGAPAADGSVDAPLRGAPREGEGEICIALARGGRTTALRGLATLPAEKVPAALRTGRSAGTLAVDFYRGSESWLATAPAVADRVGAARGSAAGGWWLWAALAALLGAWACAVLALRGADAR